MSTLYRYTLPVEQTDWNFDEQTETCFTWEYDEPRQALLALYDKGKKQQWDAAERIDWSLDLDPENPMELDDRVIPIYGADVWQKMTDKERRQVRHHLQASQISQFMHGEQGALIATAKIVQTVPDIDAKFYAATQVMDEARHVEAYSRLLHEKFELAYPITHGLKALLENGLTDRRRDMTYLTMQILIVPTVRDIGLWGPRVQKAFAEMGAMEFANVDAGALLENDNNVADQFDADMRVKSAAD